MNRRKGRPSISVCHTNVTVIFLSPNHIVLTLLFDRNAVSDFSPTRSTPSFRDATAIFLWQIQRRVSCTSALSRRVDFRHAPGHARLQRDCAAGLLARDRFRDAVHHGRPDRYLVVAPRYLLTTTTQ